MKFHLYGEFSSPGWNFISVINFQQNSKFFITRRSFHHNNKFHQSFELLSNLWMFITQWIFIMTINFNHNDEFSSIWLILSQRWTFIKTMNYLDIPIIFHSVLLNCVPILKIFSLNYNLSYGWAWLSSAQACFYLT